MMYPCLEIRFIVFVLGYFLCIPYTKTIHLDLQPRILHSLVLVIISHMEWQTSAFWFFLPVCCLCIKLILLQWADKELSKQNKDHLSSSSDCWYIIKNIPSWKYSYILRRKYELEITLMTIPKVLFNAVFVPNWTKIRFYAQSPSCFFCQDDGPVYFNSIFKRTFR